MVGVRSLHSDADGGGSDTGRGRRVYSSPSCAVMRNGRKLSDVKASSWALIGVVTVLAGSLAWVRSQSIGGTVGGALELLLIPFLVAYLVRGRKSKRNWNSFALWYFWLALSL